MEAKELQFVEEMTLGNKRRIYDFVGPLTGLCEVHIKKRQRVTKEKERSLEQNKYFHGVVVDYFQRFLEAQQYERSSFEAAKGFIKAKCLLEELVNPETGEVISRRVRGTSELSVHEFYDFIERARAWLADFFGILVPDPDPQYQLHREQARREMEQAIRNAISCTRGAA